MLSKAYLALAMLLAAGGFWINALPLPTTCVMWLTDVGGVITPSCHGDCPNDADCETLFVIGFHVCKCGTYSPVKGEECTGAYEPGGEGVVCYDIPCQGSEGDEDCRPHWGVPNASYPMCTCEEEPIPN